MLDLFAGTGALGLEALSRGAVAADLRRPGRGGAGAPARATSPGSASRTAPRVVAPRRHPARAATRARPSTSSSSTRPTAAASARRRSPRRSPAAGSRRAALVVWEEGVNQSPPPGLTLLDAPPLWGDDDRDLPQRRAAAGLRAMSEARAPARPGLRLPRLPPRPGGDRRRGRGRPRRARHHADRRRQVALLPAAGADPPRRHPGRSRR